MTAKSQAEHDDVAPRATGFAVARPLAGDGFPKEQQP
jgi:hypothetical protein